MLTRWTSVSASEPDWNRTGTGPEPNVPERRRINAYPNVSHRYRAFPVLKSDHIIR